MAKKKPVSKGTSKKPVSNAKATKPVAKKPLVKTIKKAAATQKSAPASKKPVVKGAEKKVGLAKVSKPVAAKAAKAAAKKAVVKKITPPAPKKQPQFTAAAAERPKLTLTDDQKSHVTEEVVDAISEVAQAAGAGAGKLAQLDAGRHDLSLEDDLKIDGGLKVALADRYNPIVKEFRQDWQISDEEAGDVETVQDAIDLVISSIEEPGA